MIDFEKLKSECKDFDDQQIYQRLVREEVFGSCLMGGKGYKDSFASKKDQLSSMTTEQIKKELRSATNINNSLYAIE